MNGNGKSTIAKDDRNGPKVLIQNNTQIKWADIKRNEYHVSLANIAQNGPKRMNERKEEWKREKYLIQQIK